MKIADVESAIQHLTGEPAQIVDRQVSQGGCIHDSGIIHLADGRRYFLKHHPGAAQWPGLFEAEYLALQALAEPGEIHVPQAVAHGDDWLVTDVFEQGRPAADWQESMGRQLAGLHRATVTASSGFYRDNYLGTSFQPNDWEEDWVAFWRDRRLGWQLELLARQADNDNPVLTLGRQLMERLDERLAGHEPEMVLLHGDLWAGNAAADDQGQPVIFDPASYYGQREAEWGMMKLFGGFSLRCEDAYQEIWPFAPGYEERLPVYRLYHELNHLNLFGAAYHRACLTTLKSLL